MNLQIVLPYEKCIYSCPFCISNGHIKNIRPIDKEAFFDNLLIVLKNFKIKDIVITGEFDPSQKPDLVDDLILFLRKRKRYYRNIEITTRNLNYVPEVVPDVMNYSLLSMRELEKMVIPDDKQYLVRGTLICSNISYYHLIKKEVKKLDQFTYKFLQMTSSEKVNNWIIKRDVKDKRKIDYAAKRLKKYAPKLSIWVDRNCQSAEGRYLIYRADGKLYSNWETTVPFF